MRSAPSLALHDSRTESGSRQLVAGTSEPVVPGAQLPCLPMRLAPRPPAFAHTCAAAPNRRTRRTAGVSPAGCRGRGARTSQRRERLCRKNSYGGTCACGDDIFSTIRFLEKNSLE